MLRSTMHMLLKFSRSLASKSISWNTESCIDRHTFIKVNSIDLMLRLNRCNGHGSCIALEDSSHRICVLKI